MAIETKQLPKAYVPADVESAVYERWLAADVFAPDGAVYASIAKTMVQRHNYLELMVQGQDWLDKPHVPFWLAALAFRLFGVQTWAQRRLPPVRMALLSALEPAFAALWAAVLIGERLSRLELWGGALIVLGVAVGETGTALLARQRGPAG